VASIEDPQEYALTVGAKASSLRFYRAVTATIRGVLFPYFRVELQGEVDNLHVDGPLILAPVHRSNLDSMLVGAASKRRCRALAKRSMWNGKPWAWIVSALGAFPVERGTADREALRAARMLLEQGEAMFVFPEGTRQPAGPEVGAMYDGVAYLAAKTGARALPIGIAGTGEAMGPGTKFPKRERVIIHVGELVDPPEASGKRVTVGDRAAYSERLAETLRSLQAAAYEGRGG